MGGILSKIFGTGDVIEKGFDLIDKLHTSDAEEAELKIKEIEAKNKAKTDLLASYAPFKVAQRYLALIFAITFVCSFVLVLVMTLAGWGDANQARAVIAEFSIGWIMLTIVGFYFGGGAFEGMLNARKGKPGN